MFMFNFLLAKIIRESSVVVRKIIDCRKFVLLWL